MSITQPVPKSAVERWDAESDVVVVGSAAPVPGPRPSGGGVRAL
jgi:hypothetical protein